MTEYHNICKLYCYLKVCIQPNCLNMYSHKQHSHIGQANIKHKQKELSIPNNLDQYSRCRQASLLYTLDSLHHNKKQKLNQDSLHLQYCSICNLMDLLTRIQYKINSDQVNKQHHFNGMESKATEALVLCAFIFYLILKAQLAKSSFSSLI